MWQPTPPLPTHTLRASEPLTAKVGAIGGCHSHTVGFRNKYKSYSEAVKCRIHWPTGWHDLDLEDSLQDSRTPGLQDQEGLLLF